MHKCMTMYFQYFKIVFLIWIYYLQNSLTHPWNSSRTCFFKHHIHHLLYTMQYAIFLFLVCLFIICAPLFHNRAVSIHTRFSFTFCLLRFIMFSLVLFSNPLCGICLRTIFLHQICTWKYFPVLKKSIEYSWLY